MGDPNFYAFLVAVLVLVSGGRIVARYGRSEVRIEPPDDPPPMGRKGK